MSDAPIYTPTIQKKKPATNSHLVPMIQECCVAAPVHTCDNPIYYRPSVQDKSVSITDNQSKTKVYSFVSMIFCYYIISKVAQGTYSRNPIYNPNSIVWIKKTPKSVYNQPKSSRNPKTNICNQNHRMCKGVKG